MKKLYDLSELADVSFKAYTIAMIKLKRQIGGTEEGLLEYTKRAGIVADINGVVYSPLY